MILRSWLLFFLALIIYTNHQSLAQSRSRADKKRAQQEEAQRQGLTSSRATGRNRGVQRNSRKRPPRPLEARPLRRQQPVSSSENEFLRRNFPTVFDPIHNLEVIQAKLHSRRFRNQLERFLAVLKRHCAKNLESTTSIVTAIDSTTIDSNQDTTPLSADFDPFPSRIFTSDELLAIQPPDNAISRQADLRRFTFFMSLFLRKPSLAQQAAQEMEKAELFSPRQRAMIQNLVWVFYQIATRQPLDLENPHLGFYLRIMREHLLM